MVVGSASRDHAADDPRGWRLGGPATYGALTLARLGLGPRVLLGVDEAASRAEELEWLREAGAEVVLAHLPEGPVLDNIETPEGRIQRCETPGAPLPPSELPRSWRSAPSWLIAPVAAELDAAWADVPPDRAFVALGWQGLLRTLSPGATVARRPPEASRLLGRARLVGVSRTDLEPAIADAELLSVLRTPVTLAITDGARGGRVLTLIESGTLTERRYPAIRARDVVDPTGAGDAFLAGMMAGLLGHPLAGSGRRGSEVRLAAALGSLIVERPGLAGVPRLDEVAVRLASSLTPRPPSVPPVPRSDRGA